MGIVGIIDRRAVDVVDGRGGGSTTKEEARDVVDVQVVAVARPEDDRAIIVVVIIIIIGSIRWRSPPTPEEDGDRRFRLSS